MASAFCQLSSAAAASVASTPCSLLSTTLVPKTIASSFCRRLGRPAVGGGRLFTGTFSTKGGVSSSVASMIPEDVASLMEAVYAAKPTPQVCLTTTGCVRRKRHYPKSCTWTFATSAPPYHTSMMQQDNSVTQQNTSVRWLTTLLLHIHSIVRTRSTSSNSAG